MKLFGCIRKSLKRKKSKIASDKAVEVEGLLDQSKLLGGVAKRLGIEIPVNPV